MILIEGTKKIKGVLDLSSVNLQLKNGDKFSISEDQFNNTIVQTAISTGFIKWERTSTEDLDINKTVMLRNIYDRIIRINLLDSEIRPKQSFILTNEQVNSSEIRGALAKGLIEIVSSAVVKETGRETDVFIGDIFKDKPTEKETATPKSETKKASVLEKKVVKSDETTIILDTNEEVTNPKVIEPPPKKSSFPPKKKETDPKKKTVVWNPNQDPIPHTRTTMDSVSVSKEGVHAGIEKEEAKEIKFVDKEMQEKRIQSNPALKNKNVPSSDDIDFI